MGVNGRNKGSNFERLIAKLVVDAFVEIIPDLTAADCYRTPLSGGHIHASKNDPGDLVMSLRLAKYFPAHVECKKQQGLEVFHFFDKLRQPSWGAGQWLAQAEKASVGKHGFPLVVMTKNNHPILCCWKDSAFGKVLPSLYNSLDEVFYPRYTFLRLGEYWHLSRFDDFLSVVVSFYKRSDE